MPEEKKSLIARICEACDAVGGIEKKGKNEFQNYKYVKAADVAKAIRHEFFTRNILLVIDEKEFIEIGKIPTKSGNPMPLMLLKCEITFYDGDNDSPEDQYQRKLGPFGAFGTAADSGDKSVYKCKTGALKYVLRSIGLIPDEKDDPEADENVDAAVEGSVSAKVVKYEHEFDQREEGEKTLLNAQLDFIKSSQKSHGITDTQLATFIKMQFNVNKPEHILRRDFDKVKDFTLGKIPLQDALQMSVEAVAGKTTTKTSKSSPEAIGHNWALLYATAKEKQITQDEIKQFYTRKYKVTSGTELTEAQFAALVAEVATWNGPSITV